MVDQLQFILFIGVVGITPIIKKGPREGPLFISSSCYLNLFHQNKFLHTDKVTRLYTIDIHTG
jgi:hypothetical protein